MSFEVRDLPNLVRGDRWTIQFIITDPTGATMNISGNQYWLTLKSDIDLPDNQAEVQVGPVLPSLAASGEVTIIVESAVTDILDARTYNYDFQEVEQSGNVNTLVIGKVRVTKDVTRSADYDSNGNTLVPISISGTAVYSGATTTTSPTEIFLNGTTNDQLVLQSEGVLSFNALVAGKDSVTLESCSYMLQGAIEKDLTTTSIIGSVGKFILGEENAAFDANIYADDASDALRLEVTAATTNETRWTAKMEYTEVVFS